MTSADINDFDNHHGNAKAKSMIQAGQVQDLITDLHIYNGLSLEIADGLIINKSAWDVAMNMKSFAAQYHQQIAQELIDSHNEDALVANFTDFQKINRIGLIKEMVERGSASVVLLGITQLGNLDAFDRLDIANALIETGELELLERFKFVIDQQDVTRIDYGTRGNIPLVAFVVSDLEVDIDGLTPTIKQSTSLLVEADGQLITGSNPSDTIAKTRELVKNGFNSWKTMTRIQRGSYESDFSSAVNQLESLSVLS